MHPPERLLFVYGSLLERVGVPEVDEALKRWCRPLGAASMCGRLYSLGAYPGLKPAVAGHAREVDGGEPLVKGRLLLLLNPGAALRVFDRYEEFHPGSAQRSEFVRARAAVTPKRGAAVEAQVYFYNRSARGRRTIAGGDFLAWRKARAAAEKGALK